MVRRRGHLAHYVILKRLKRRVQGVNDLVNERVKLCPSVDGRDGEVPRTSHATTNIVYPVFPVILECGSGHRCSVHCTSPITTESGPLTLHRWGFQVVLLPPRIVMASNGRPPSERSTLLHSYRPLKLLTFIHGGSRYPLRGCGKLRRQYFAFHHAEARRCQDG